MTPTTKQVYSVLTVNLTILNERLEKLNAKAIKVGSSPILTKVLGHSKGRTQIEIDGISPVLDGGYRFIAALEHLQSGNVVKALPTNTLDLSTYRQAKAYCVHCNTVRHRLTTYLVAKPDSIELVQVGSDCLKDFLGHRSPHAVAQICELINLLESSNDDSFEGEGGGYREKWAIYTPDYIAQIVALVEAKGYVTRKMAQDSLGSHEATASEALRHLYPTKEFKDSPRRIQASEAHHAQAQVILEWIKAYDVHSDFTHNMKLLCSQDINAYDNLGTLAYIVPMYNKALQIERERAAKPVSNFIGAVGDKLTLSIKVVDRRAIDSHYGISYLFTMLDSEGNRVKWFASNDLLEVDKAYTIKGTVKALETYKGLNSTLLTRCKIVS